MLAISKKLRTNAAVIYKLLYYLNTENLTKVYHALITSHLRYCITACHHGNHTIIKKIQSLCNNLIKQIIKIDPNCKMNLLDVNDIFILEMGKFMHNLHYNQLPQVFQELFKINQTVYTIPTRNKDNFYLQFFSKNVAQQSIAYSGIKLWNALPNEIKTIQTLSTFIRKLKQHLYNQKTCT